MTNWSFCLAGLPDDPSLWHSRAVLQYLLLLSVMDSLPGVITAQVVSRSEVFYLPRCGYCRWYRIILYMNSVVTLGYSTIVFLLTLLDCGKCSSELAVSACIFALGALTAAWFQTLLILIFDSILVGFSSLILIQLLSLYNSNLLLQNWKLLFPGNWAMALRSTLATPSGFTISIGVIFEVAFLLAMWHSGWRLVRWHKRKV